MNTHKTSRTSILLFLLIFPFILNAQNPVPLRLGVAGVTHGHLNEVIVRMERGDFKVVGVAEPNAEWRENNGLRKKQ